LEDLLGSDRIEARVWWFGRGDGREFAKIVDADERPTEIKRHLRIIGSNNIDRRRSRHDLVGPASELRLIAIEVERRQDRRSNQADDQPDCREQRNRSPLGPTHATTPKGQAITDASDDQDQPDLVPERKSSRDQARADAGQSHRDQRRSSEHRQAA
jgi:hypothetical protein